MQNKKIKFIIPGFYWFRATNMTLLDLINRYPQYFRDDFEISGVYDGFPYDIWSGNSQGDEPPLEMIHVVNIVKEYQKYGLSIYLNETAPLKPEDAFVLGDVNSQNIAGAVETERNGVIVTSELLERSIRISYPKYKMIYLDRTGESPADINRKTDQFDLVIASPLMNMAGNIAKEIKTPEKIALVCNDACHPCCNKKQAEAELKLKRKIEIRRNNQPGVAEVEEKLQKIQAACKQEFLFHKIQKLPTFISRKKIDDYVSQGVEQFVICGLDQSSINLTEAYVYYLAKEEYRDTVRNILLNMMININAEANRNR